MQKNSNLNHESQSPSVLLVEDDAITASIVKTICESFGCSVALAEDGVEALAVLKIQKFDLIFMDLQMPRMGGFETAYEIRQMGMLAKNGTPLPIVAVSAYLDKNTYMRCLQTGMNACIDKPYTLEKVRNFLNVFTQDDTQSEASIAQLPRSIRK